MFNLTALKKAKSGIEYLNRLQNMYSTDNKWSLDSFIILNGDLFERFYEMGQVWQQNALLDNFFKANMLDNSGKINLDNVPYIRSKRNTLCYTSCDTSWIILPNLDLYLLKEYKGTHCGEFGIYNNLVVPEIAKQFRLECAQYYIARFNYVISPNFLKEGEELIHGYDIIHDKKIGLSETNVATLISETSKYLSERRFDDENRSRVRIDFIKQSIFNRFIVQRDENEKNWGIIVSSDPKNVRLAPIYDLEHSCGVEYYNTMRQLPDGSHQIGDFIETFKNEDGIQEFLQSSLQNFNIENIFDTIKLKMKTEVPDGYKHRYRTFFEERVSELREGYERAYNIHNKKLYNIKTSR